MKYILLFGLVITSFACRGQQLSMERGFGSVRFYLDSTELAMRQVRQVLAKEPLALQTFNKARTNQTLAGILGAAGGFMIGFQVGSLIGGGEPEWGFVAGGAALVLAAIPLQGKFYKQAQESIDLYNKRQAFHFQKPKLYLAGTGVKLVIRF